MSPKDFRKIAHSGPEISLYLSNFSEEVSQLTDIQEIWNDLDIVQKYPGNISKKIKKDISSRTGDIPILA